MLEYGLKSFFCLLILFGFYRFFLENENMPVFKRFYLLTAVIFSLALPLITLTYTVEAAVPAGESPVTPLTNAVLTSEKASEINWWQIAPSAVLVIYLCGVLFFAFRYFKNLFSISREISNNEQKPELPYIFVLIRRNLVPHSFLRYIFLGKSDFENNNISPAVLEHEKAHVDQKHSWDLLFIEFLHILFWFNPVYIELKKAIRLNHEFLADRKVLSGETNPVEYSQLLFSYNSATHHNSLYSPINNSLIKKRILMISKNFSSKRFLARLGFLIPVLALCIFLFNNEIVAKPAISDIEPAVISSEKLQQPSKVYIKIEGKTISLNGEEVNLKDFHKELDKLTEGLSAEEISEMDFNVQIRNADDALIGKLEKQFQKTRFAKVTGMTILPPPPPPAPEIGDIPPPAPPAPAHEHMPPPPPPAGHKDHVSPAPRSPEHPPHPPMPPAKHDSLRKMAMIDRRMAEREKERMLELEEKYADDKELLQEKKEELIARSQERREQIEQRMTEFQADREQRIQEHQAMIRDRQKAIQERQRLIQQKRDSIRNNNSSDQ